METISPSPNPSLEQLAADERMSVRAFNVCRANGLLTLRDMQEYLRDHGTFTKLRNAGRLTEQELVGICQKYEPDALAERQPGALVAAAGDPYANEEFDWSWLTPEQVAAIDRHFRMRRDALSTRARGLLDHIVPRIDRDARSFLDYFGRPENRWNHPHAGRVTIAELVGVRCEILEFANSIRESSYERGAFERLTAVWREQFGLDADDLARYRQDFLVRRFPLFRFLKRLFDRDIGLAPRDLLLMRHRWNYILGAETRTLEELGAELGLTRERVRQIANAIPSKIRDLIVSLGPVHDFLNYEALAGRTRDLIIIDEEFAEYINNREGVSFTATFYATVFEAFLRDSHDRVEEDFDAATDYLVIRDLSEAFSFDDFLRDVAERLSVRIPETYILDLKEHIRCLAPVMPPSHVERVAAVCELLAREEFGVEAVGDGRLIFQRNTRRTQVELIADLLEERAEPTHVDRLVELYNQRNPESPITEAVLRGNLQRSERFARYDASVYGLREWEKQYSHLKSGTFADIAETFLSESDAPRHLNDVADYVLQFRASNRYSVIATLKADTTGRFHFFEGGMIGLSSREYHTVSVGARALSNRALEAVIRLVRDIGGAIATERLVDYCSLHYRIPPEQARTMIDRAAADGRLQVENGVVRVA